MHRMPYVRNALQSDLDFLKDNGEPFTVATFDTKGFGTISYPAFQGTNMPYNIEFVKVLGQSPRDEFMMN